MPQPFNKGKYTFQFGNLFVVFMEAREDLEHWLQTMPSPETLVLLDELRTLIKKKKENAAVLLFSRSHWWGFMYKTTDMV